MINGNPMQHGKKYYFVFNFLSSLYFGDKNPIFDEGNLSLKIILKS